MVARFEEENFKFEPDKAVPDHTEGIARAEERDQTKFWLQGLDTFSDELYTLAIDIDDMPTADILLQARLAHLEETQPTPQSGGQEEDGIQDRVYIRHPAV